MAWIMKLLKSWKFNFKYLKRHFALFNYYVFPCNIVEAILERFLFQIATIFDILVNRNI